MTTLVLTLLVKDEIDIIRDVIDYHLFRGVSHIILTDNRSSDGTREVADEFRRQGVLTLIDEPGDDYSQAQWVTRMARLAATEFKADWVINSDADEFWWPVSASIPEVFLKLPPHVGGGHVRRINFLPSFSQEGHFLSRMVWREIESRDPLGLSPLLPKIAHRGDPGVNVRAGNHAASGPRIGEVFPLADIEIFHFPVRSYLQLHRKILSRGSAYERNTKLAKGIGRITRSLYRLLQEGKLQDYWESLPKSNGECREGIVQDVRLFQYLRDKRKNG